MLGDLLREARLGADLSKQKLADLAQVSVPAVRLAEQGRGTLATLDAVTTAMKVHLTWAGYEAGLLLGQNLAARRKRMKRSQRNVAAALGVSKNTIVGMERTDRGRIETLSRLLRLLRVRPRLAGAGLNGEGKVRLIPAPNGAEADRVYTPHHLARLIIEHFRPRGRVLDPCRGTGAFYDQLDPETVQREWCEVEEGRDFFTWTHRVDWVMSNPPWSRLRDFLRHSMEVADNVVFLATLNHYSTKARLHDIRDAGFGMREILLLPTPKENWPHSGFQVAAVHVQREWTRPCRITDRYLGHAALTDLPTGVIAGAPSDDPLRPETA